MRVAQSCSGYATFEQIISQSYNGMVGMKIDEYLQTPKDLLLNP